ncbi:MAG: nicotinate phosphoribosyltransferase [Nitrososphaerales archaeon]
MSGEPKDRTFWISKEDEIKQGKTTDVYLLYTRDVLKNVNKNQRVVIEVFTRSVDCNWGVVTGIYEVAKLLEGMNVNVRAMEEGEIFQTSKDSVVYEPVMQIEATYTDIAIYENPILGLLCFSSGVSTKVAKIRIAAGDKNVFSFGTRRAHPAMAPTIERAAYIAGFNDVSNLLAAELLGIKAVGTMPHALILNFNDQAKAWKAFDEFVASDVPRIALVDTLCDEKTESLMALDLLKEKLDGVRLDTPSSRRGNRRKIIEEVRWELNIRNGKHVKIYVSGGLDEEDIAQLRDIVDSFGVGTSVSSAKSIDFSFKIVEFIEYGRRIPRAKRGDIAGSKQVYRDEEFHDVITMVDSDAPSGCRPLLTDLIVNGKIVKGFMNVTQLRDRTVENLKKFARAEPTLKWV